MYLYESESVGPIPGETSGVVYVEENKTVETNLFVSIDIFTH